jgi:hypothetical protein
MPITGNEVLRPGKYSVLTARVDREALPFTIDAPVHLSTTWQKGGTFCGGQLQTGRHLYFTAVRLFECSDLR